MGGKKKGGLSVLWIPRKKKHHGHGNHKTEEKRPKASAFPSGSSHPRHQGIPFIPGEHRVGSSENISIHVDKSRDIPKMAEIPLIDVNHSIEKDVNPSIEKIDEAQTSSNKINRDIPESVNESKEQDGDNIDSVYLRKPPPEKATARPVPAAEEEDSCGDKCLLFFFRCLDFGLI